MKKIVLALLIIMIAASSVFAQNAPQAKKEWTLLLYFVPDEKIEDNLVGNINSIAKVGSGDNLNILVYFDYASNKPSTLYYVNRGGVKVIKEMGKTNTGSPQVFYDFLKFGMTNYPANRYAVIVNSHGSGWESFYGAGSVSSSAQDDSQVVINAAVAPINWEGVDLSDAARSIAYDSDSSDCLTLKELKKAMGMASKNFNGGRKIDIFVADACLFAMIEAAYELRDAVNIVMGSESTIPGNGLDYKTIAAAVSSKPGITNVDLAKTIASSFTAANSGDNILIGVNTDLIEPMAVAFSDFTQKVLSTTSKKSFDDIKKIGDVSKYSDIWNIMDSVINKKVGFAGDPKYPEIAAQAKVVKENYQKCLAAFSATGTFSKTYGGLSVYWPDKERYPKYREFYKKLDFAKKFFWDEFLDSTLLGMTVQPGANAVRSVETNTLGIVSDLDSAFSEMRVQTSAGVKASSENQSAKVEFLKKRVVEEAVAQHKVGNRATVHAVLKALRNSKSIDNATKNALIEDLKKGVASPVK